MTGTGGLDGMGGMHGSTGGGSSLGFDQGREMVRPSSTWDSGCTSAHACQMLLLVCIWADNANINSIRNSRCALIEPRCARAGRRPVRVHVAGVHLRQDCSTGVEPRGGPACDFHSLPVDTQASFCRTEGSSLAALHLPRAGDHFADTASEDCSSEPLTPRVRRRRASRRSWSAPRTGRWWRRTSARRRCGRSSGSSEPWRPTSSRR